MNQFLAKLRERIISLRRSRGLSQKEVASLCEISLRKYQRIESSDACPRVDLIFRLSRLYGVNLIEFFSFEQLSSGSDRMSTDFDK